MSYRYLFLLLLFLQGGFFSNAQNLYDAEHSLEFADYLRQSGQYRYAAQEYERVAYLKPENDSIKLLMVRSYRKAGEFEQGLRRLRQIYPKPSGMPLSFSLEYARMLSQQGSYKQLEHFAKNQTKIPTTDQRTFQLYTYLMQERWEQAHRFYQQDSMDYPPLRALGTLSRKAMNRKHRSAFLATAMSAVIPGSGKMYTGHWRDGLISLFLVGGTAWQAYRGYQRDKFQSVHGWIFGGISFAFYIGNLYGSAKSAKLFNRHQAKKYRRKTQQTWSQYY